MTLPPNVAARVKRLIPLLASPIDGEALGARNAIGRELAVGQCDWHDLGASIGSHPEKAPFVTQQAPYCFGDLARAARDLDRGRLTQRERAFVADMCAKGFSFRPWPRQADWLRDIYNRLAPRAAA